MEKIYIHEVGMRDGLQMESKTVPTETKILWFKELMNSGVDIIQLGSFVNPAKMPQMADTDELFKQILMEGKPDKVVLSGLVLNEKGMERAINCGVELLCMGVSASETHSKKNTGMTTEEASTRIIDMAKQSMADKRKVQCSVQSAFGCGFEGAISEDRVYAIIEKYLENGIKEISLADTAGHATPIKVERMFAKILEMAPDVKLTCHFHNTYGMGMANCYAAMRVGVKYFETAFGGLGGCPFTKIAAGNVCTEDFAHFLKAAPIRTDINIEKIIEVTKYACDFFVKELPGFVYKTGGLKYI